MKGIYGRPASKVYQFSITGKLIKIWEDTFDFKNNSGKSWNALRNLYKNK